MKFKDRSPFCLILWWLEFVHVHGNTLTNTWRLFTSLSCTHRHEQSKYEYENSMQWCLYVTYFWNSPHFSCNLCNLILLSLPPPFMYIMSHLLYSLMIDQEVARQLCMEHQLQFSKAVIRLTYARLLLCIIN